MILEQKCNFYDFLQVMKILQIYFAAGFTVKITVTSRDITSTNHKDYS